MFSFQPQCWLADVAPHPLNAELCARIADARQRAAERVRLEALIPPQLLYSEG